jgi:hypothetical protein
MGCCKITGTSLKKDTRFINNIGMTITIEEISQISDESQLYESVTHGPSSLFIKRDVKQCFKNIEEDKLSPQSNSSIAMHAL